MRNALSDNLTQLVDIPCHVIQLDLVSILTAQKVIVCGTHVDTVQVATGDALPNFGGLVPGKNLDLALILDDKSLLEQINLPTSGPDHSDNAADTQSCHAKHNH